MSTSDMALDLSLKNRKRALEKENEPLDMSAKSGGANMHPLEQIQEKEEDGDIPPRKCPKSASGSHYKKLAIVNWTWSKYKSCKRKMASIESEDGLASPKRISPDLPRGDCSPEESCPVSPTHLVSTPPPSPGYLTTQRLHRLPPLLSLGYPPRHHTSLLMSPPASPGYLRPSIMSPPDSPLGCLPARALGSHLTSPSSPMSPAAVSSPIIRTAPASTRRDSVFFTALPEDPRDWNRADVYCWLRYIKEAHNIEGLHYDRFLMNGKALCLMNVQMFQYRVPKAGKLLYRDFRLRLSHALQKEAASQPSKQKPQQQQQHSQKEQKPQPQQPLQQQPSHHWQQQKQQQRQQQQPSATITSAASA